MLERGLAALVMPDNDSDGGFDFGAFLVQLEKEAKRHRWDAIFLAHECYPTRMDEWQRKFLISFLGQLVLLMLDEREKKQAHFQKITREAQEDA